MPSPGHPQDASPVGPLMEKLGMEWIELAPERLAARIPVETNTQPLGLLHGGASAALAETLASVGAWLNDPSKLVLGIELKVNHLRSASRGWITAEATPLHRGRTTQLWEIRLADEEGRMTAFATCTLLTRDPSRNVPGPAPEP
jgi:1,4-dihydroxy-2-naphthoyl-CoA hydrolase